METYKITRLLMLTIIGILTLIKEGLGIECYNCNSKIHPQCDKLGSLSEAEKIPYIVQCWRLEEARFKNYTMCRRIMQDVDGEKSTVRQCATAGTLGSCTRKTGTRKIKMEYCECNTDLCNHATPKLGLPKEIIYTMFVVIMALTIFT